MKNESLTDAEWGIPSRYHMSNPKGQYNVKGDDRAPPQIHTAPYGIKAIQNVRALWILWQRNAVAMPWLTFYGKFSVKSLQQQKVRLRVEDASPLRKSLDS